MFSMRDINTGACENITIGKDHYWNVPSVEKHHYWNVLYAEKMISRDEQHISQLLVLGKLGYG